MITKAYIIYYRYVPTYRTMALKKESNDFCFWSERYSHKQKPFKLFDFVFF